MTSYTERLREAVKGAVCRVSGALDSAVRYTFGTDSGAIGLPLCDDPQSDGPPPPPFSGGQCPGVSYRVAMSVDVHTDGSDCENPSAFRPVRSATGPIRGVRLESSGTDGPCDEGEGATLFLDASNPDGSPNSIIIQGVSLDIYANARITDITPNGGLPDDCGDPTPPPPPPPPPQPINFTYVNNEGDEINVEGDLNIGIPILIAPFTLVAPISLNLGGINFDGSVQISPDFNLTISPTFGGGGGGSDVLPEPIAPDVDDPTDGEPDEPVECRDKPIKALIVSLDFGSDMLATELIQNGSIASIGVPRVATLYFEALAGNRRTRLPGIDLKSRTQLVPAPYNATVVCWRIHTEPGVSIRTVRPVFDIPT